MKTITAIIIDDEEDNVAVLQALLSKHCPLVNVVDVARDAEKAVELINEHDPHLVFLDIEMPGENGFSIFSKINNPKFHTIIVSGYPQYAMDAIKHSAIDYLLKPVMKDELIKAVNKLDIEAISSDPRTEHLLNLLKTPTGVHEKLVIPSTNGYKLLDFADIVSIQGFQGSYSVIKMLNKDKTVASESLNHFESLLPEDRFIRIHRGHLIAIEHMVAYDKQKRSVRMVNDEEFAVSTRKSSVLLKALRENGKH